MPTPNSEKHADTAQLADQGFAEAAGDFEPLDLDERSDAKPSWREQPRLCLADSATDPLDGVLLEQMRLFERESRYCLESAAQLDDLFERSRYMTRADSYMDQVRMIHDHRHKYQNYGRQEITLTNETAAGPLPRAKPARPAQFIAPDDGMPDLDRDAWRNAPCAALLMVAKNSSEILLLEHVARLDEELRRCLAKADSCWAPAGRASFAKLALDYAKKVLQIADSLRKPHAKGRQQIIIKHETAAMPVGRPRQVASRRRSAPRQKTSIAI